MGLGRPSKEWNRDSSTGINHPNERIKPASHAVRKNPQPRQSFLNELHKWRVGDGQQARELAFGTRWNEMVNTRWAINWMFPGFIKGGSFLPSCCALPSKNEAQTMHKPHPFSNFIQSNRIPRIPYTSDCRQIFGYVRSKHSCAAYCIAPVRGIFYLWSKGFPWYLGSKLPAWDSLENCIFNSFFDGYIIFLHRR